MVGEDLLVEKNRQLTTIHYHERYRRTVVKHIGRHGEQERNARKLKEQTRSNAADRRIQEANSEH